MVRSVVRCLANTSPSKPRINKGIPGSLVRCCVFFLESFKNGLQDFCHIVTLFFSNIAQAGVAGINSQETRRTACRIILLEMAGNVWLFGKKSVPLHAINRIPLKIAT